MSEATPASDPVVRHFRQILIWPLSMAPPRGERRAPWQALADGTGAWDEVPAASDDARGQSAESRYAELVYFLPFVRRLLFGGESGTSGAPMRTFGRDDVATVALTLRSGSDPLELAVHRVRLHVFELSIAILVVEVSADDVPLPRCEEILDRFGRAYPPYWEPGGAAGHCPARVEWKSGAGSVLAVSDYEKPESFVGAALAHGSPPVAAHWDFLLAPLVPRWAPGDSPLRYEQVGDERIPIMAYLTFDDPGVLARADFVRLGFATPRGRSQALPYATSFLRRFEEEHCYDRFWDPEIGMRDTRYVCSAHAFTMIGVSDRFHMDAEAGLLSHFRHHYFRLGLVAHLQKAALLMLCDRLARAVARLEGPGGAAAFREDVRDIQQALLQFTHRYWFREVSNHLQPRELFELLSRHLGTRELHQKVVKEAQDVNLYLDVEEQKKQTETTVRLTAVATLGLAMGLAVGFLGMNLFDFVHETLELRITIFAAVAIACLLVTIFTVRISGRVSDLLDRMASGDRRRRGG